MAFRIPEGKKFSYFAGVFWFAIKIDDAMVVYSLITTGTLQQRHTQKGEQ